MPPGRFLSLPGTKSDWQGVLGQVEQAIASHPRLSFANKWAYLVFYGASCRVGREVIGPPVHFPGELRMELWFAGTCRRELLPDGWDWAFLKELNGSFWRIALEEGEGERPKFWLELFEKEEKINKMFPGIVNWREEGQISSKGKDDNGNSGGTGY